MSEPGAVEFGAAGGGSDPRAERGGPPVDPTLDADALPSVARPSSGLPLPLLIGALVLAGVLLFVWLNGRREARQAPSAAEVGAAKLAETPPPPLKIDAPPTVPPPVAPAAVPPPQFTVGAAAPPASALPALPNALPRPNPTDLTQRARAPTVVVDLGAVDAETPEARLAAANAAAKPGLGGPVAAPAKLSDDENFANRVDGAEVARARTTQLGPLDHLIPQGAVITAVLETAINSDLPGYARAVVSRDVRSFDGRNVLIPRGSRLIGQYKSAVALGATRAFVIWTRVIRADGVSIQIASPATDPLGRAGLEGKVNRHFFERFGGAILLSVLSAGTQALANSAQPTAQVNIGNSSDASSVASTALQQNGGTPPTITIMQGAAVKVFVARDLDFSLAPVTPAP